MVYPAPRTVCSRGSANPLSIVERSRDKPGSSDLAVVQFRRMMVKAAKRVAEGAPAIGTTEPRIPHVKLASYEGIVPKSTDWRTLGNAYCLA